MRFSLVYYNPVQDKTENSERDFSNVFRVVFYCFTLLLLSCIDMHFLEPCIKIKLFNFFKILKRCSIRLVLPSYVVVRKNPVSISLFMLKGVKSAVSLTRNKLKMFLFLTRCFVVSPFLYYLYCLLLDVGLSFHSNTYTLESLWTRLRVLENVLCK